ncbi:MAG: sulfatase-like hydrolase/transferase [Bacteroidetes bacterium]|nr:sulfatase-like hydrolase/transferase [Bacteroidota bacterium]
MKKYIIFYCLLLFVGFTSCTNKEVKRPNIVLIMADDMGYECIGANGSTEYLTPNIDRLSENGLRFEHAYSQPLCTPSRVKIMTGKFNYRNYEDFGYLNTNQKTFGNLMQDAGYATLIAGKWQLNGLNRDNENNQDVNRPYHFGFDEYCLWQLNRAKKDGERFANPLVTQNGKDLPRDVNAYGPQIFADYISDFIDRKAEQPFFVYYPMVLVHDPFVPTPDSPEWADPSRRYEKDTAYFADMVNYTDKIIGQLEAKLKEKGVWENTLFIFTGDNGTHPSVVSSTNYAQVTGGKGFTKNTGNHVPFVFSWPEQMKGKRVVESIISFVDILPTICDAAGVNLLDFKTDGKSILPIVTDQNQTIQDKIFIHYSPRWGGKLHNRWVMNDEYKLYQDGRFFNTVKDTSEIAPLTNLLEPEMKLKAEFQKLLDEREADFPFSKSDESFKMKD